MSYYWKREEERVRRGRPKPNEEILLERTVQLCSALKQNKQIQIVEMHGAEFYDACAEPLSTLLEGNTSLKSLHLGRINFTLKGIQVLCKAIQQNTSLEIVDLGDNFIKAIELEPIINAVSQRRTIKELYLGNNPEIGRTGGMRFIIQLIKARPDLRVINLNFIYFSPTDLEDLDETLKSHEHIIGLGFSEAGSDDLVNRLYGITLRNQKELASPSCISGANL